METLIVKEYITYNEKEILNLYKSVGWTNYTNNPEMLKNAYAHSLKTFGAYVDDKLVGVVRVVGDGYSVVFIQDLLVFPEYHRQGIGTMLMKQVLQEYEHVYQKNLFTDDTEKTIQFYKSLGFMIDSDMGGRAFSKMYS